MSKPPLAVIQRSEATKDLLLSQTQNEVSPFRRELQNAETNAFPGVRAQNNAYPSKKN
jgi:hypothetical protein